MPLKATIWGSRPNIAELYNITREQQDEYALLSHQRACKAMQTDYLGMKSFRWKLRPGKGLR